MDVYIQKETDWNNMPEQLAAHVVADMRFGTDIWTLWDGTCSGSCVSHSQPGITW